MTALRELLKQDAHVWDLYTARKEYGSDFTCHGAPAIAYEAPVITCEAKSASPEPAVSAYLIEHGATFDYGEDRKFAVCTTHDIDELYPPWKHTWATAAYYGSRAQASNLWKSLSWKRKGKEFSPYRNFEKVMDLEERYGAKSSFYFIATPRDIRRFRYDVEDVRDDLATIIDRGWEVGLHGGYYAYNDVDEIRREKARVENALGGNRKIVGYRNHYLRFAVPDTWRYLADAGFTYDITFGFNDAIGFRNGMCHPFVPFDLNRNEYIPILEIPLIIQDGALFEITKSEKVATAMAKRVIDVVERHSGVVTLLWHSFLFDFPLRKAWLQCYENVLEYCVQKGAWITSGEEIAEWYAKNVRF